MGARIMARICQQIGLALVLIAFSPTSLFAQSNDATDRAKLLRQIADQKAEADTTEAIQNAEKLAKASPTSAVKNLKAAIGLLDRSFEITSEKRSELVKRLEAKIAVVEGRAPAKAEPDPKTTKLKEADQKALDAAKLETKEIREAVTAIEKLYDANKFAEAQAKTTDIGKKYPNNPSVLALTGQGMTSDRVAVARDLAREQSERMVYAMNDVARSALPAKGDIEFPKGFAEKMKKRDALSEVQLGPEEEAILKSLESQVKTGIKNGPFEEVVESIATLIQKPIYLDRQSLTDVGLDMKKPVTLPDNVSARTGLRAVLQSLGLTFIIKEKAIQVVTLEEARKTLVKKAYYMGDVLSSPLSGGATIGPVADFFQATQSANAIIDSIKKSVDPLGWQGQGGNSSILFHAPSMSIIVSAPAEIHYSIGNSMKPRR